MVHLTRFAFMVLVLGAAHGYAAPTLEETVRAQGSAIARLEKLVEAQSITIEKLEARLEKPAPPPDKPAAPAPKIGFVIQAKPKTEDAPPAKLQIKTLWYADFSSFGHTGFGPQFLESENAPGPGNGGFDAFEITRAYLNFYFSPTPDYTLRVTPDIYRQLGTPANDKAGLVSGFAQNVDMQPGYRLKYAFLDYNSLFRRDPHLKGAKATFGQQQNPLIDWEEHLYGYRYTSLVPWTFTGFPSTQLGASVHGPVRFHEGEQPRGEYDMGIYDVSKFSQQELSSHSQFMARLTAYPWGLTGKDQGLGFTAFGDWGFTNTVSDLHADFPVRRFALMAHYNTPQWSLAAEYDAGANAFGSNTLFTSSGPQDQFGLGATKYAATDALARALLDNPQSRQRGWATFGHYRVGTSPFELFGLAQWFEPNIHVAHNPFDFCRTVAGISYQPAPFLRMALDHQHVGYAHAQPQPFEVTDALFMNMEFFY